MLISSDNKVIFWVEQPTALGKKKVLRIAIKGPNLEHQRSKYNILWMTKD